MHFLKEPSGSPFSYQTNGGDCSDLVKLSEGQSLWGATCVNALYKHWRDLQASSLCCFVWSEWRGRESSIIAVEGAWSFIS